jgi:hypothetical protein
MASARASLAQSPQAGFPHPAEAPGNQISAPPQNSVISIPASERIDLSPARWIWFPSQRTLPNTFVLFRRELNLPEAPAHAQGWITADSRYRLMVNGRRIQWGPAPCDPRYVDVDPINLTAQLKAGANVLGVEVLFFGSGESTWVTGKPGLLCRLEIEYADGRKEQVISDDSWWCYLDRAHRPGQYKRWYLRALQEEFDARLHPNGWDTPGFTRGREWVPAMKIQGPADKPTLCHQYPDDLWTQSVVDPAAFALRKREIPVLREIEVPAVRLAESGRVEWSRDPRDWFESRIPGSFRITREPVAKEQSDGRWELPATPEPSAAVFATFEFKEEMVAFPYFTIDAPEGTMAELIYQESHDPARTAWLDTHWFAWSRFICREGVNRFETFDFEPLRWLQLHIRNAARPVTVSAVGVRRRMYPWPQDPHVRCSDSELQKVFDAAINNLHNSALEVSSDPGRERQQYGGAGSIQLHGVRYAFGETTLPHRMLRTYSEGITTEGFFLDPWPAFDMLERFGQLQIGTSIWGEIDEGVGFVINCWQHYLQTGDLESMRELYPRFLRFAEFLERVRDANRLLPVENIGGGVLNVWLDDDAFQGQIQRSKQCAFNLYAAAMFQHALAPLARAFGEAGRAAKCEQVGQGILAATVRNFWSPSRKLFVDNLPWLDREKNPRLTDRSLATAILYDLCPGGEVSAALRTLVECPANMGLSYPMNSIWRYWALARLGRMDVVLKDFRERWSTMNTVVQNNCLPEVWNAQPDTRDEFCYFEVTPLNVLFMDIAGIRATAPGFPRCEIRPQLCDMGSLELTAHTVRGPIQFSAEPAGKGHSISITVPQTCQAELLLPSSAKVDLPELAPDHQLNLRRFRLKSGEPNSFICQT